MNAQNRSEFYGNLTYVKEPDGGKSECKNLSNDKENSDYILAPDSDYEPEEESAQNPTITPETDFEDSSDCENNVTLTELAEQLNPGKWRKGNLVIPPGEIKFLGKDIDPADSILNRS